MNSIFWFLVDVFAFILVIILSLGGFLNNFFFVINFKSDLIFFFNFLFCKLIFFILIFFLDFLVIISKVSKEINLLLCKGREDLSFIFSIEFFPYYKLHALV